MKRTRQFRILPFTFLISGMLLIASCATVDVFEKNVAIPNHAWSSQFTPEINFDITDTVSLYNIFVVVRHTDAYRYKNIWMNLTIQQPDSTSRTEKLELQLATDSKGWLGTGMDDIYEHRIAVTSLQRPVPLKRGTYRFKLTNVMREDPLEHVMNVGIRVEKAK
ncbi:gliding motility lipoprotein GldH [Paraflavitalea sp. CAU 1676]|uniref:gliding motility lipoprotein GldH n=1 Tax=Paraflavitalea sp. CAU 1676 TaxID=3032598 RepID=UPI0023DC9936|nr:gliding motility lipoprotein GldH [Paraflavitalea sp. CAU 1676]MDF2190754.1 gliding motility lipoprotein GldH [Paraflavitalea sp. CAU 1676]